MLLFDSHAHVNFEEFTKSDRDSLIKEIEKSDLAYVMDVGCDLESSVQAVKDSEENPWCYAAVGYHPHDSKKLDEMTLALIKGLTKKDKVKAIGEIGLDYYYDKSERDTQQYWFRRQIQMANELRMPIIIHTREADDDTMRILKEEGAFSKERQSWFPKRTDEKGNPVGDSRVLLHCFSGSSETARQYVKLGGTISICGPVTFKNNRKTVEVVEKTPIEFLLVETDSPFLTPEPYRGKQNMSPFVEFTAKKIAEIKGMTYEEVAKITCQNAKNFFDII